MVILNKRQIENKITRIASEILERHSDSVPVILAGINKKGLWLAEIIKAHLTTMGMSSVKVAHISLNPAKPLDSAVELDLEIKSLAGKIIIVVDDVANSGRTLFFAMRPFMDILTERLEACVLVERMHKSYPISVDYVGVRLATTTKQNIEIIFDQGRPVEGQLT